MTLQKTYKFCPLDVSGDGHFRCTKTEITSAEECIKERNGYFGTNKPDKPAQITRCIPKTF